MHAAGGTIAALSADAPAEAAALRDELGLAFPVLGDPGLEVVRAYGLVHPRGGPGHRDIGLPAQVLVGRDGRILWRYVAHRIQDRAAPDQTLAAVEAALPR